MGRANARKTILETFYWFSQLWRDCERCGFGSASRSITPLSFQRRSLESSNEFSFYVTRGCVERTGKRWSPTQVDFEPSNAKFDVALRHVDGGDTNVTRGFELRRTVWTPLGGHIEKSNFRRNMVRAATLTFGRRQRLCVC